MGSDPPFRVVSENSETELRTQRLLAEAEFVYAEFAANFLRVLRGAGKPWDVLDHMAKLLKAVSALDGFEVSIDQIISPHRAFDRIRQLGGASDRERWSQDGTYEWHDAENKIIDGALQIIASRIAGQLTHETKGEHELHQGLRWLEEVRDRQRRANRRSR
jgi:hypothetical protein